MMVHDRQIERSPSRRLASASRARSVRLGLALLVSWLTTVFGPWVEVASARDGLFRALYVIGTESATRETNRIGSIDGFFDRRVLEDLSNATYDPLFTAVVANIDLRGLDTVAEFQEGDTRLFVRIPSAGIDVSFDGGDRDASVDEFIDWLDGNTTALGSSKEAITSVLQALVAESPVDPVAGNPLSLQTLMMQAPYDVAMRTSFRPRDETVPDGEGLSWRGKDVFDLDADFTPFWAGDWSGFRAELDPRYTLNLREPRLAFVFDLPLAYTQTEADAHTFTAQAGVGMLLRLTPWWNLMTDGRVGMAGSLQLGGLGVLWSTGVTSHMQWQLGETTLRMGNAFSASSSIDDLEWFGIEMTYDLTNYLVRNGLEADRRLPGQLFGRPLYARVSFTDSWVLGSDVFVDHYNELGLHLVTRRSLGGGSMHDVFSFGLAYTGASEYHALRVSLGYAF